MLILSCRTFVVADGMKLRYPGVNVISLLVYTMKHKHYANMPRYYVIRKGKKIKQSHYRPGQVQRVPGGWSSQISRQSSRESGKVVSPTHRSPLTQEIFLVLISVRGWVNPRAIVRPEGLSMKNSSDTIGNRTRDLPTLAQCLNQLRYRVLPLCYTYFAYLIHVLSSRCHRMTSSQLQGDFSKLLYGAFGTE